MKFQVAAAEHGLVGAKPWVNFLPYDAIVDNGKRLFRVQVKSVGVKAMCTYGRGYSVTLRRHSGKAYSRADVDFIAALVVPRDVWYIIPVDALEGRDCIYLYPDQRHSRGKFERYKEAWELLGGSAGL
jgi:hypothetical protein